MSILARDAREMANQILGTPLFRPPVTVTPRLGSRDIGPGPLDWTAEWLRHQIGVLDESTRKRIVLACIGKRDVGRTLMPWEAEIVRAWDQSVQDWRARSSAEGGE